MTLQGVKRKVVTVSDFRFTGRLLGKGNFARVEEAVHNVLNVKVAIKIIDTKEIKEKYVIKNLHREARIMSALNHPCIVSLFQTMQMSESVYYLITEMVSGGDLCSFIIGQRYGKLEERPARVFGRQFASALAHMHSFGIVHRDLKMENVMLNASQTQIKIVDFGLSNVWSSESPLRTHCGSPEYAAPELFIAGKEYGPEVDLWSLGIIFYGMVVGQLPFVGGRKHELSSQERRKRLVAQINKGLGTTQRQALAPLSPEFRTLLNKLLTADPAKRISIKELLAHPWITEKGKKSVQKHPFKQLDNIIQTKITMQLADLFQVNEEAVSGELLKNPFGRLGGMYNILKFKYIMEDFNPENIAPTVHKSEVAATPIKVNQKPKTSPIAKSQHTLYNQCIVLLNKVSQHQVESRAKSANQAANLTKSPSRTRPKTENAHTRHTVAKANYAKITSLAFKRNSPEKAVAASPTLRKTTSSKLGIAIGRGEPASASLKPRPHTTETRTTINSSKPNKRTIVSAAAPKVFKESNREFQRRQTYLNMAGMGDEICAKHLLSNVVTRKPRQKKPLENEPIARSIAGYVLKNVPNYMLNKSAEIRK